MGALSHPIYRFRVRRAATALVAAIGLLTAATGPVAAQPEPAALTTTTNPATSNTSTDTVDNTTTSETPPPDTHPTSNHTPSDTDAPPQPESGDPEELLETDDCEAVSDELDVLCGGFDAAPIDELDSESEPLGDSDWGTDDQGLSLHVLDLIDPALEQLAQLEQRLMDTHDRFEGAGWAYRDAIVAYDDIDRQIMQLADDQLTLVTQIAEERAVIEQRAAMAYVRGPEQGIAGWAVGTTTVEVAAGSVYVDAAAFRSESVMDRLDQLRAAAADSTVHLLSRRDVAAQAVAAARAQYQQAGIDRIDARRNVEAGAVRVSVIQANPAGRMVFPVAGDSYWFSNDWGQCRGEGCRRSHQGTDIVAPRGTPAIAMESGHVARIGNNRLGGNKVWLIGDSGTEYYYAHFDSFVPGMVNGQRVRQGETIGYIGNTGAPWAPYHLHLQVHPGGGKPVNPFPLLKAISDFTLNGTMPALHDLDGIWPS